MRLFVAIAPPPGALAGLAAALAPLRPKWPGLRWTGTEAWHLTLAFLGEVRETALPELTAQLAQAAAQHPPLTLSVTGAGAFPTARSAHVLWAGVTAEPGSLPAALPGDEALPAAGSASLAALAASVAAAARAAGAPPPDEGRAYRPHLTLARCRLPADVRPLVAELAPVAGPAWTARDICLIASDPDARPRYATLARWPMQPADHDRGR